MLKIYQEIIMCSLSRLLVVMVSGFVGLVSTEGVLGQPAIPPGTNSLPMLPIKNSGVAMSDVSGGNGLQLSNDQQEFTFKSNSLRLSVPGGPTFVLPPGFQLPPEIAAQLQSQQQAQVGGQVNGQVGLQGPLPPTSQSAVPVFAGNGAVPFGPANNGLAPIPPPNSNGAVPLSVPPGPNGISGPPPNFPPASPPNTHFNGMTGQDDFKPDDVEDAPLPPPPRSRRPSSEHHHNKKDPRDRPLKQKPDSIAEIEQVASPVATFSQLGVGVYQGWGSQSFPAPPKQSNSVDYFHSNDY